MPTYEKMLQVIKHKLYHLYQIDRSDDSSALILSKNSHLSDRLSAVLLCHSFSPVSCSPCQLFSLSAVPYSLSSVLPVSCSPCHEFSLVSDIAEMQAPEGCQSPQAMLPPHCHGFCCVKTAYRDKAPVQETSGYLAHPHILDIWNSRNILAPWYSKIRSHKFLAKIHGIIRRKGLVIV